jgi:hypothetical protein
LHLKNTTLGSAGLRSAGGKKLLNRLKACLPEHLGAESRLGVSNIKDRLRFASAIFRDRAIFLPGGSRSSPQDRPNTKNTKNQAPNTKEIPSAKLQTAARASSLELGAWGLELLWCLVFGVWCLVFLVLVFRSPPSRLAQGCAEGGVS